MTFLFFSYNVFTIKCIAIQKRDGQFEPLYFCSILWIWTTKNKRRVHIAPNGMHIGITNDGRRVPENDEENDKRPNSEPKPGMLPRLADSHVE